MQTNMFLSSISNLQTVTNFASFSSSAVAWFTFDSVLSGGAGSGMSFSNDNRTVSADGWEHRVALGSVGFSRGVHYWEFTIDKYTADTDPAFGIARIDVARDMMLGELWPWFVPGVVRFC